MKAFWKAVHSVLWHVGVKAHPPIDPDELDFEGPDYSLQGWGPGRHVQLWKDQTIEGFHTTLGVWGHYTPRPRIGDTLLCECEASWVLLMFTDVDYCQDPGDMFFGDVLPVMQKDKESGEVSTHPDTLPEA